MSPQRDILLPDQPNQTSTNTRSPWLWVPSLYFAEGLPYIIVIGVSVVVYERLGLSNTEIALYTSWLYLPWVIKPVWSPLVDLFGTRRGWVLAMQFTIGAALACLALTIPAADFVRYTLAVFWLLAFASATHDIAADGFYMLGLDTHNQVWFVGIRSTFYRVSWISGQGLLVMLAGYLESRGTVPFAWSITFLVTAAVFLALAAWHWTILPRPTEDALRSQPTVAETLTSFVATFASFLKKPAIVRILAFLLLFRFAEAQLARIAQPFLLDSRADGGLAMSTLDVGFVYGTVGMLALTAGGILGGLLAARDGLKYWLWWMVAAINVPNLVYVALAIWQPADLAIVSAAVALEQFGYGFGFAAFTLYMIYVADGPSKTSHYAICTGFMALGMMLPGMASGLLQETIGYQYFFTWVLAATLPSFLVTWLIPLDAAFGRKSETN